MALQASIRDHSSASLNEEAPPWGGWPAGSRFVTVCLYMVRVIEAEREREREREDGSEGRRGGRRGYQSKQKLLLVRSPTLLISGRWLESC